MDNDKLLIGGIVIIALLVAAPFLAPMFSNKDHYDAVADSHKLEKLNNAISAYGQQHQQYPPSLFYLVPDYLPEIPLTSTNLQFGYDPATGALSNPSAPVEVVTEVAKDKKSHKRNGGGGISPATDSMTGLGVSQELNY